MSKNTSEADVAFISALAELLNKNELTELSVKREYGEDDSLEVRVVKQATVVQMPPPWCRPPPQRKPPHPPAAAAAARRPLRKTPPNTPARSPRRWSAPAIWRPNRGPTPFVTVGAQVSEGQTVLIIEAMKTMNHIPRRNRRHGQAHPRRPTGIRWNTARP
jgi:acetyl-CoA carboxylase biotin carboxyl carrier protein